jgi:hypothetical protein
MIPCKLGTLRIFVFPRRPATPRKVILMNSGCDFVYWLRQDRVYYEDKIISSLRITEEPNLLMRESALSVISRGGLRSRPISKRLRGFPRMGYGGTGNGAVWCMGMEIAASVPSNPRVTTVQRNPCSSQTSKCQNPFLRS